MNRFFRTLDTLVFGKKFTITEEDSLRGACMDVLCRDLPFIRDCDESEIESSNFSKHIKVCTGKDLLLFVDSERVWVVELKNNQLIHAKTCVRKLFMEFLSINTPVKRTMRAKGMRLRLDDTVSIWCQKIAIAWREAGCAA